MSLSIEFDVLPDLVASAATTAGDPLLDDLNAAQRAAVVFGEGPQLVLAGAGTGKTRVLTRRIAWLIASRRARPSEILALTFTEKAAQEMEERVDRLVPFGFADTTIATFHAFGRRLLDEFGMLLGLPGGLRVLTQPESVVFLRERLWQLPLERLRPIGDPTRNLSRLVSHFGRLADEDVAPEAYAAFAERARAAAEAAGDEAACERAALFAELAAAYGQVRTLLAEAGLIDFAGLLSWSLRLVREHPAVREELRRRYRYVLVDEFQDTNTAQFELVRTITGRAPNLTVVGDDDQSIYRFRGAAISNILGFRQAYPAAATFVLTENYRSSQAILDAAYRLIRHNDPERLEVQAGVDKRLVAKGPGREGPPVEHQAFDTPSSEADHVAARIAHEVATGRRAWGDFAVLVRRHAASGAIAGALALRSIPFRISGGGGLFDRPEVAACVEALRLLADPTDDRAFYFLATSAIYDVPVLEMARLAGRARRIHRPLEDLARSRVQRRDDATPADDPWPPEALAALARLVDDLDALRPFALDHGTGETLYRFLDQSGTLPRLTALGTAEADEEVQNLARLFELARGFAGIAARDRVLEFVRHLELVREAGANPRAAEPDLEEDAVHVLTVHAAKGLEFPVVFLVGLEANHFPGVNRRDPLPFPEALVQARLPGGDFHRAEERRLFYVGMTRAKEELWLSSAADHGGPRRWKPSPFVLEALDRPLADVRVARAPALAAVQRNAARPALAAAEPRPMADDAPLALSHHQIDDYRTCPLKYKFAHLLAVPLLAHHSIGYGQALHLAIRDFYAHEAEGWPLDEDGLAARFDHHWTGEGFITREHEETRKEQGRAAIRGFHRRERAAPSRPAFVESSFEVARGATTVRGRFDRVDLRPGTGAVIVDFKSSDVSDPAKADERAERSLQLKLYALAWAGTRPAPAAVELHYVGTGVVGRAPVTPEALAEAGQTIDDAARGIRARAFAPTPSFASCGHCAYNTICPSRARGPF
jgi:DNA helicase-2/ATP-dependent DNA helicase PcrA